MKIELNIDTDSLTSQCHFLNRLITTVADGGTYPVCKADLDDLTGIQSILATMSDYACYKPCINKSAMIDLAHETVKGYDLEEGVIELAEISLIDFWSSPEGADDLASLVMSDL